MKDELLKKRFAPAHIVILGAGGHARVIADIVRSRGDVVMGFLDDRDKEHFPDLDVLGRVDDAPAIAAEHTSWQFIIGIGNNQVRRAIAERLKMLPYYTAVHSSAVVSPVCGIGVGTVVMPNAVINADCTIGKHCIINTAATVDHDDVIADYVHLSPGVHLSGEVTVGECGWLGTGCVVSNQIAICGGCTVGAGAVVIRSITEEGVYAGVPAARIGEKHA